MAFVDISAESEEQAIAEGLQQLGIAREAVRIEVLSSEHDDTLPGAEPLPGSTVRLHVLEDVITEQAKRHLLRILQLIGLDSHVEVLRRRGGTVLNILAGKDGSLVIGRNGQNLEALQVLVNRMVVHGGRDIFPLHVDCEGYREKRINKLLDLADKLARRVQREGREIALEPMSSADRKVLHNAVKEHRGVYSISRGEGPDRHLVVCPGDESDASRERRLLKPHPGGRRGPKAEEAVAAADAQPEHDEFMTGFDDSEE